MSCLLLALSSARASHSFNAWSMLRGVSLLNITDMRISVRLPTLPPKFLLLRFLYSLVTNRQLEPIPRLWRPAFPYHHRHRVIKAHPVSSPTSPTLRHRLTPV